MSKVSKVLDRAQELFNDPERINAHSMWQTHSHYILNNTYNPSASSSMSIDRGSQGQKNNSKIYDGTAPKSNQELASAIQGITTNPATNWSQIKFASKTLNDSEEATTWLADLDARKRRRLNESNFNTEIAKSYQSVTGLGTMLLFHEGKFGDPLITKKGEIGSTFKSLPLINTAWSENKEGIVDTVYRKFQFTAKQAMDKWGNKNHENIKTAFLDSPNDKFGFIHAVYPRPKGQQGKPGKTGKLDPKKRPVVDIYIDVDNTHEVFEAVTMRCLYM